ncbi:hypothetical protein ACFQYP_21510 [Nonomuraea antimicrobica]
MFVRLSDAAGLADLVRAIANIDSSVGWGASPAIGCAFARAVNPPVNSSGRVHGRRARPSPRSLAF